MSIMYRIHETENFEVGLYKSTRMSHFFYDVGYLPYHKTPEEDKLISPIWEKLDMYEVKQHLFGFKDLKQIRQWLSNDHWIKSLEPNRMSISIVDSDHIHYGETQAIFDASKPYTVIPVDINILLEQKVNDIIFDIFDESHHIKYFMYDTIIDTDNDQDGPKKPYWKQPIPTGVKTVSAPSQAKRKLLKAKRKKKGK